MPCAAHVPPHRVPPAQRRTNQQCEPWFGRDRKCAPHLPRPPRALPRLACPCHSCSSASWISAALRSCGPGPRVSRRPGDGARCVKARTCSTSANIARNSGSKPSSTTLGATPTKPPLEGRCIVHSRRKRQESAQRPQLKRAQRVMSGSRFACTPASSPGRHTSSASQRALLASCSRLSAEARNTAGGARPDWREARLWQRVTS